MDGQARRGWLDNFLAEAAYYVPPELRPWGQAANALNPVNDVLQSMEAAGRGDWVGSAVNAAPVVAPMVGGYVLGKMGGGVVDDAARFAEEALTGFGYSPSVNALADTGQRFAASEAGSVGADPAARRGAEIMDLLTSGRASEVTDDMLDMGDPVLNTRLNEYLWKNYDLPMDAGSRAARAAARGFDTDAYHATRATEGFAAFRPGARGSVYMAATPDAAMRGAAGQALENPYAPPGAQSVTATLPLSVRSGDIDGLGVNAEAWRALPEVVDGDEALRALQPQIEGLGAKYWDDVYLSQPRGDGFRYYRNDPPVVSYADVEPGRDVFGYRLPGWNSGSDVPSLNARAETGKSGFLVSDEAGSSIVASLAMPIRSRFARFDPRLAHLRNLSAGVVPLTFGLNALATYPQSEQY